MTEGKKELYGKLDKVLGSHFHAGILTHIHPDGDAIGSILGLYWYLIKKGFTVSMATPSTIPGYLRWMEGADRIMDFSRHPGRVADALKKTDLVFYLDFNEPNRLGGIKAILDELEVTTILIDHHPDPAGFADYTISSTGASSTAELIYGMICGVGGQDLIDRRIAECIFTGIMTDTGCFSHNSSDPRTYELVAGLLRKGIDKDRIHSLVYDSYSTERMRLLGYSLKDKMVVLPELRTAYISLTVDELRRYNHKTGDTEGFVNYPFTIGDIRITALFMERDDHVKISFRSKGGFRINEFAKEHFNGGGHLNAAGGECFESLEGAVRKFEELISDHADEIRNLL